MSIKKNFILNILKILINLIFPLITFPYISRILLPEGIGKITYVQSINNYFLLFINLGIPLYGIREIAKVRNNKLEKSKVFSEIFFLNIITTILGVIVYICFYSLNIIKNDKEIFLIFSLVLLFNFLSVDWFFQGIEDYQYITIRTVVIKILSALFLFIFVKKNSDVYIYSVIVVFSLVGSNFFNIVRALKLVDLKLKRINIKRHLKGIFIIFSMNLAISIYTNLDSVMLGSYGSKYSLGIYSAASKIIALVMGIVTSLGAVLLPRISNYIEEKKEEEIKQILEKTLSFLLFLIIPSIVGIYFTANEIILLFAGKEYLEAITTLKILSLIILFIGFSNFIGIQILYPRGEEKKIFYSVLVGAITNFSLNLYLIPRYYQNGAAFATCVAEFTVVVIQIFLGYKYLKFQKFNYNNFKFLIASFIMGAILYFTQNLNLNLLLNLILKVGIGSSIYILLLIVLREDNIHEFLKKILIKFRRKNEKI
jgi:O-antigen/teichoic acid export membrane protein